MPSKRNRRRPHSACGHSGYGAFCHRCSDADKLVAKADAIGKETVETAAMRVEAQRLKSRDGKVQPTVDNG